MNEFIKSLDVLSLEKSAFKTWWLYLGIAISWAYSAVVIYAKNWYGVYPPRALLYCLLLIPLFFYAVSWAAGRLRDLKGNQHDHRDTAILLALSLAIAGLLTWLFPPPWPAFSQPHLLKLVSKAESNPESKGAEVRIEGLRSIDGPAIPLESLQLAGDWRLDGDQLASQGKIPGSTAELETILPGGVDLRVEFGRRAGKLLVQWDNDQEIYDLYSPWSTRGNLVVFPPPWKAYTLPEKAFSLLGYGLYFLGIAALIFILGLMFQAQALPTWLQRGIILAFCLATFFLYVGYKRSYANFDLNRVYGDTITYARAAQIPLTSRNFWFSDRAFTLPLIYKAAGVTSLNYQETEVKRKVADIQTWISILAWTFFGLAVAANLRKKWLAPVSYALVLFFSLSLDISVWDRILYSESISFSLFVLLLALWISMEKAFAALHSPGLKLLYLFGMILITVLYSFTRDTNLYFILVGALVFALATLLKKLPPENRTYYGLYIVSIFGLFFFQNLTIRLGNRWQIHIYDTLARRVTLDPQALKYYQEAGLPVSQKLLDLPKLGVFEYQDVLLNSNLPEYRAIRDWVGKSGQSTFIRFLLTHPDQSLLKPLRNFGKLLNGNNVEYRDPIFPGQPIPEIIKDLDQKFYPRGLAFLIGMVLLPCIGIVFFWTRRGYGGSIWLMLTIVLVSVPPLAVLIWNANPLEIERHASQIGVQLRLAAWLAGIFLVDWFLHKTLNSY